MKIGVTKSLDFTDAFCDSINGWAFFTMGQLRHNSGSMGKSFGWQVGRFSIIGLYLNRSKGLIKVFIDNQLVGTAFEDARLMDGDLYWAIA